MRLGVWDIIRSELDGEDCYGNRHDETANVFKSAKKGLPVVAINTTAGTSAEITINYVITDEERKVKMVMVDKNSLALISVNDPELMVSKPAALTATTSMDASQ